LNDSLLFTNLIVYKCIHYIKEKYVNQDILIHIYSQGNIDNFNCYKDENTILHIDEDLNSHIWKNSKRNEMLEELNLQVAELIQKGAITYSENGFIIISITETNTNFFTQQ
jgi:hypothetical protein